MTVVLVLVHIVAMLSGFIIGACLAFLFFGRRDRVKARSKTYVLRGHTHADIGTATVRPGKDTRE